MVTTATVRSISHFLNKSNAFSSGKQPTGELMTNWSKGVPENNALLNNNMKLCKPERSRGANGTAAPGSPGSHSEIYW